VVASSGDTLPLVPLQLVSMWQTENEPSLVIEAKLDIQPGSQDAFVQAVKNGNTLEESEPA
jgi:hypothetical protein